MVGVGCARGQDGRGHLVGSSKNMIGGLLMHALAVDSRFISPPLSHTQTRPEAASREACRGVPVLTAPTPACPRLMHVHART